MINFHDNDGTDGTDGNGGNDDNDGNCKRREIVGKKTS